MKLFRSSNTSFIVTVLIAALWASGCDGCKDPKPEAPAPVTTAAAVDVGGEEDTREESLYEARMRAQTAGTSHAVHVGDVGRSLSAEIEAAASKPRPPKPKIEREAETGSLKKAQLNSVFNAHAGAMKKCYERVLKNEPGLAGKVRIELLIGSNGSVRSAKTRGGSLRNATVQDCMERHAKTMKFPEPSGGAVRVTKTYSFTPEF